ncbi:hypothetical protein BCR42DRAFT_429649 [Absidia repens]|uniref:Uncharacterized protein n=1 Tax=Absidia repens TaxID=90262 RepID=A0A1X2HR94_9FUNG|nr:hypothetical protein BCR42DRAFT_429649 [Absidia repens]
MVDGSFTSKFEKATSGLWIRRARRDVEVKDDVAKVGKTPLCIAKQSPDKNSSANLSFVCMIS